MKRKIGLILCIVFLQIFTLWGQGNFTEGEKVIRGKEIIHTYEHQQTGLDVVWIETDDTNWSFVLGVKTPVKDDTGVNHIIEHTVFKGTQKYPSHQLFFEASAKYPHSFMNAMTSADMTYYPFSTPYPKCFEALLDVYLQSVFHPLLLEQPYSFYEEAYYQDKESQKEGGVVYNEMKGATASVDRQIFRSVREAYFKGSTYGYDSGGIPQSIPTLTYDQFKETYNAYYYPGNMRIVLYGNLPIDKTLETIGEEISTFEEKKSEVAIDMPLNKKEETVTQTYQTTSHKAYLMKSFLIDAPLTQEQEVKLSLWVNTYLQNSDSAFQTKMREQGMTHVQIMKDEGMVYPVYTIVVGEVTLDQLPTYSQLLDQTIENLRGIVTTDVLKEKDTLARTKLALMQEADSSGRGLNVATSYLEDWLHGDESHSYYAQLDSIKTMTDLDMEGCQKLFEKAARKTITVIPTQQTSSNFEASPSQLESWKGVAKKIEGWKIAHQQSDLPQVTAGELMMKWGTTCDKSQKDGVTYLVTETQSQSLCTTFYYPTHHIQQDQLPYLFLYSSLLEQAAREHSPFEGFVEVRPVAINDEVGEKTYLKISVLETAEDAKPLALIAQMNQTLLGRPKSWYVQKLEKWSQNYRESFGGDLLGTLQNLNESSNTGAGRYLFETQYPLYEFVREHVGDFSEKEIECIQQIGMEIGLTKGAYVGLIGNKEMTGVIKDQIIDKVHAQDLTVPAEVTYAFKPYPPNNIYYRSGGVDYLVYSYENKDKLVNGEDYVMAAYGTLHYLQPLVRGVQGAYGSGLNVAMPYRLSLYTYRDPDYRESMKIVEQMEEQLPATVTKEKLDAARTEALGAFQRQYQLLGSRADQGEMLQKMAIMGIKAGHITKTQKQIVSCTKKQLDQKIQQLEKMIQESRVGICTQKNKGPRDFKGTVYE